MGLVLVIRDDRGRFVTRLHPNERTALLWKLAAEARGLSIEEFVRDALRDYLNQFEPQEDS